MIERIKRYWEVLKSLLRGDHSYDRRRKEAAPQPAPPLPQLPPKSEADQRYRVENAEGQEVGATKTFVEAHQLWKEETGQEGRIIDTQQNDQDVTPPRDDDGRYAVLGDDGEQHGSFDEFDQAVEVWKQATEQNGKIIDMQMKMDVTPRSEAYLNDEQLVQLFGLMAGSGPPSTTELGINLDMVRKMAQQINNLPLHIFDLANISGLHSNLPTKTVPIKRRKVVIEKVRELVEVDAVETTRHRRMLPVMYPTDESEPRLMRSTSEFRRVRRRSLALPPEMLARRIARRELPIDEFQEEVVEEQQKIRKKKVWQEVEKPRVEEWTEDVEVAEETQAQLLLSLIDISGSMVGLGYSPFYDLRSRGGIDVLDISNYLNQGNPNINLAVALKTLLVGKHIDDGSRYFLRQFADIPGDRYGAETPDEKRELIAFLLNQRTADLGGGTQVQPALEQAARDVRKLASRDDRPEILIITDGETPISAEEVYACVGNDALLHTVIVNGSNYSLKQHSSSYNELHWDGQQVTASDGSYYSADSW